MLSILLLSIDLAPVPHSHQREWTGNGPTPETGQRRSPVRFLAYESREREQRENLRLIFAGDCCLRDRASRDSTHSRPDLWILLAGPLGELHEA